MGAGHPSGDAGPLEAPRAARWLVPRGARPGAAREYTHGLWKLLPAGARPYILPVLSFCQHLATSTWSSACTCRLNSDPTPCNSAFVLQEIVTPAVAHCWGYSPNVVGGALWEADHVGLGHVRCPHTPTPTFALLCVCASAQLFGRPRLIARLAHRTPCTVVKWRMSSSEVTAEARGPNVAAFTPRCSS